MPHGAIRGNGLADAHTGHAGFHEALWRAAPDDAWLAGVDALASQFGGDHVEAAVCRWVAAASRSKPGLLNRSGPNRALLHGAVFAATRFATARCVDAIRQLGQAGTENRTPQGLTSAVALALIESPDALGALHLLAQRAKRPSARQRFERAAAHVQIRTGLSADDAAERFVPTFGLDATAVRIDEIGGCTVELRVDQSGDVEVQWRRADGKPLKSAPASARQAGGAALAEFKATAQSIERMLSVQRDRLDRIVAAADAHAWRLDDWRSCYVDHPLVGTLARRLVWLVDGVPVIFTAAGSAPVDLTGTILDGSAFAEVRVWHPVARPTDEVLSWRRRLAALEITQPFKQAHREVYVLTDAERETRRYSNRFAAHVIRQHQFRQLAMQRGWEAPLKLIHDGAADSVASKFLPRHRLRVEFWTQPAEAGDDALTPAGAFLYLSTDQVRFYAQTQDARRQRFPDAAAEPLPLEQVPPLALSEAMRDVDLFVGVASVGNDPTWQDGGPEGRYRTYWHSYSFGDLSETANTRRQVLESLLPRLTKLKDRWRLDDRFLVIRGDIRTYKIHLGSGNILMEPNDQYLCIVPSRGGAAARGVKDVFLPFEGDATLSVILSKAFLLADDENITDPTILSQIRR